MTEMPYSWTEDVLSPLGETGVTIGCGDAISEAVHRRVMSVCALLEKSLIPGVFEWLPSFASVTLFYDPLITPYHEVCRVLLHH